MLYLISWLTDCALILFIFSVTRLLAEKQADGITLGVLGALFFLSSAISNAYAGRICDRIGRRLVSLTGAACLVVSLAIFLIPGSAWWQLYLVYPCVGLAVGQIYPPVIALLSHGTHPRQASLRFLIFGLCFNFGILCGQAGGGWLYDHVSPQAPVQAALVLASGTFLCLCCVRQPSDLTEASQPAPPHVTHDPLRAEQFVRLGWLANCAGMFSMSTLWFLFPKLLVTLSIPADTHGLILSAGRATVMLCYLTMHLLSHWHFRFRFSMLSQTLGCLGMLTVSFAGSPLTLGLGVILMSVMMGYNYFSSLFYNRHAHADHKQGRGFGLNEAFLGLGAAGGSLLGGLMIGDWGTRAPFGISAVLILVALSLQMIQFRKFNQRTSAGPGAEPLDDQYDN